MKSPLDSFKLSYEKEPLFKEKRYRGPLPKPPFTKSIETSLRWITRHPVHTATVLVFALLAPLQHGYALKPDTAPVHTPQTIQMVDTLPIPDLQEALPLQEVYIPRTGIVPNCGDNVYANYIYMHESGCNTEAVNWLGCTGIGQSCPASKIAYCGTDYDCQNAWFTQYANAAYGGWAGAYGFWLQHSWW